MFVTYGMQSVSIIMPNIMFGSGSDNLLKTSPKFRETADLRGCLPCTRMKITVTVFVFSDKHKKKMAGSYKNIMASTFCSSTLSTKDTLLNVGPLLVILVTIE